MKTNHLLLFSLMFIVMFGSGAGFSTAGAGAASDPWHTFFYASDTGEVFNAGNMLEGSASEADLFTRPSEYAPVFTGAQDADTLQRIEKLFDKALEQGSIRLIVGLTHNGSGSGVSGEDRPRNYSGISAIQEQVQTRLNEIARFHTAAVLRAYDNFPAMAVEVDDHALYYLLQDPDVAYLQEDRLSAPMLSDSTELIGADQAWLSWGIEGSGVTVAILDTGVEKNHPHFSGRVVSEACYSSNYAPHSATSLCPGGVTSSTAVNSGLHCTGISGCDHGTHVAGIAAGRHESWLGPIYGVARNATVIAIQVFSRLNSEEQCGAGKAPCVRTYSSDWLAGLDRVYTLRSTYNIAAANMSLGGGRYTTNCDASYLTEKGVIDDLRDVGIATIIASGNDSYTNAIGYPACISSGISVGSTTKSDLVSDFSNSASFLDLLAPGSAILAPVPGISELGCKSGTSMAAPHVTGAWALLKEQNPEASVSDIEATLKATGAPITDSRNGIIKPRIQVNSALESSVGTLTVTIEPAEARSAGAQWSVNGGSTWLNSGSHTVPAGTHTITYKGISGWQKPANVANVSVADGGTTARTGTYVKQTWSRIHPGRASSLAFADVTGNSEPNLFGSWSSGIWYLNGSYQIFDINNWTNIHPSQITTMAFGDIDGNGNSTFFGAFSSGIWHYHGDYSGGFDINDWTQIHTARPDLIAFGDITGEGKDTLFAVWSSGVWYYHGDYSSGFKLEDWTRIHPGRASAITLADVTGNGKANLFGSWSNGIWYYEGNYSGEFKLEEWTQIHPTRTSVMGMADITGDGKANLFSSWSNGVWYYDGNYTGGFNVNQWTRINTAPANAVGFADVTGDGKMDFIGSFSSGVWMLVTARNLTVTINPADARTAGARWSIDNGNTWHASGTQPVPPGTYTIIFNDIALWTKPAGITGVTVTDDGTTARTASYVKQHWTRIHPTRANTVAFADATRDGTPNLFASWSNGVWYYTGDYSAGDFDIGEWIRINPAPATALAFADVTDNDGIPNLFGAFSSGIWYYHGYDPEGSYSNGFDIAQWTNIHPTRPTAMAFADVTGDGTPNLFASWSNGVWYYTGDYSAGFNINDWIRINPAPATALAFADVRDDGIPNLFGSFSSGIWYYHGYDPVGLYSGEFNLSQWTQIHPARALALGFMDATGDGKPNLFGSWSNGVWYYRGDYSGGFDINDWTRINAGSVNAMGFADITGDTKDNFGGSFSSGVWVLTY